MSEKTAKQNFSDMGMTLFVYLIVASVLQMVFSVVINVIYGGEDYPGWMMWIIAFVPMYCIALPICYTMMKRVPKSDLVETKSLKFGGWLKWLTISFFVMIVGNIIGLCVGGLLSLVGINTAATIETLTSDSSLLGTAVLALLAPMVEELIFRKWLIDRMHVYGGKVAIVTSALMFGLFHGNFTQFFYAFFLGIIWGYIYYKTGKVIYSMLMHMTINFLGGVIAPMFVNGMDLTDPFALITDPKFLGLVLYEVIMIVLAIVGCVFFFLEKKKVSYAEEAMQLPKEEEKKTPWCNLGMILFLVACIALFVFTMIASTLG